MTKVQTRTAELKKWIGRDFKKTFRGNKEKEGINLGGLDLWKRLKRGRPEQADLILLTIFETLWLVMQSMKRERELQFRRERRARTKK